jgi:UDP-N-acetylglucosamine 2-epimerase (non-hydrolysing)
MEKTVALIVGTRPEAVKMAPVFRALKPSGLEPVLISTGQHRELLETAFAPLELTPDHELSVMTGGQSLNQIAARVLERLPPLLERLRPAALLVQGDTTTTLASALCAYHLEIPVGHVEAGLRTYDHRHPFPEEANRQLADRLCRWCFAPTEAARQNLLAEKIEPDAIHVTGNTAVDSLLWILEFVGDPAPARVLRGAAARPGGRGPGLPGEYSRGHGALAGPSQPERGEGGGGDAHGNRAGAARATHGLR